jgi:hypothetical protein
MEPSYAIRVADLDYRAKMAKPKKKIASSYMIGAF